MGGSYLGSFYWFHSPFCLYSFICHPAGRLPVSFDMLYLLSAITAACLPVLPCRHCMEGGITFHLPLYDASPATSNVIVACSTRFVAGCRRTAISPLYASLNVYLTRIHITLRAGTSRSLPAACARTAGQRLNVPSPHCMRLFQRAERGANRCRSTTRCLTLRLHSAPPARTCPFICGYNLRLPTAIPRARRYYSRPYTMPPAAVAPRAPRH